MPGSDSRPFLAENDLAPGLKLHSLKVFTPCDRTEDTCIRSP